MGVEEIRLSADPGGAPGGDGARISEAIFSRAGDQMLVWSAEDATARVLELDTDDEPRAPRERTVVSGLASRVIGTAVTEQRLVIFRASTHCTLRAGSGTTLRGHSREILAATASRSGEKIVTGSADGTVRVWSGDGKELLVLEGPGSAVQAVALEPSRDCLAAGFADGTVRIWTELGGEPEILTPHPGGATSVTFSHDGSRILVTGDDGVVRLSTIEGNLLREWNPGLGPLASAALSSDGRRILVRSEKGIVEGFGVEAGDSSLRGRPSVQRGLFLSASFLSPDGRVLTVSNAGAAGVWGPNGEALAQFRGGEPVTCAIPLAGGARVALGAGAAQVIVWDPVSGESHSVWSHEGSPIAAIVATPDGRKLVLATVSEGQGSVELEPGDSWRASSSGYVGGGPGIGGKVFRPAASSDPCFATFTDGVVVLWSVEGQRLAILKGHTGGIEDLALSPDGSVVATASWDGTARLWSPGGDRLAVLRGHAKAVRRISFRPDGRAIATASQDGTARVFDLEGRELAVLRGHEGPVRHAVFSPGGHRLATAGWDRTVRLWDASGRSLRIFGGPGREVDSVSFSPDGTLVLGSAWDGKAYLWSLDGAERAALPHDVNRFLPAFFSPAGDRVFTLDQQHTCVWDLEGNGVDAFPAPGGWSARPVLSPAGERLLVSSSGDGAARLHSTRAAELLRLARERLVRDFTAEEIREFSGLFSPETRARVETGLTGGGPPR